jgi:hypothetical protein
MDSETREEHVVQSLAGRNYACPCQHSLCTFRSLHVDAALDRLPISHRARKWSDAAEICRQIHAMKLRGFGE